MLYPKLRPIEIIPFDEGGKKAFALRDPTGLAPQSLVVTPAVVFILQRLDGRHDLEAIRRDLVQVSGQPLPLAQLQSLIAGLDEARFLEGPAFEAHRKSVIAAYRRAPRREPTHGGMAYPLEPDELKRWHSELTFEPVAPAGGELVGAAAPHIDVRFGGASCRQVHSQLRARRGDADTLVVLGTGHCAGEDLFTLTRQHYGTPVGTVETDLELANAIAKQLGEELFAAEILHAQEHSIEFQALFAALEHGGAAPRMLPILVGSFHPYLENGVDPWKTDYVRRFVETLSEQVGKLGRRVAYLASIDLSHLGPRYGDERGLSEAEAKKVEADDRALLRFAEQGDAEGFFRHNHECKDARRVCGFSALYTLLRLLPGAKGRLLDYRQTTFPQTSDTVAHCSMVFER